MPAVKRNSNAKRLLAIDTSASPGFAVIEWTEGGTKPPKLVYADALKTTTDHTDAERFTAVFAFASLVCFRYGPFDIVVREHFTKGGSKRATQLVFGGWAAVDLALKQFGYTIDPANEITPSAVKKAVGISGKADKLQVEQGVRQALGLADDYVFPNNGGGDASDAAAVGIAYLKREGAME